MGNKDYLDENDLKALQKSADLEAEKMLWEEEWFEARPKQLGFTIDPPDSGDMDDAIWIEKIDDREAVVQVSIADVGQVVVPGSDCDKLAYEKIETLYYGFREDNALPDILAKDKLSLVEGEKRLVITISFRVDLKQYEVELLGIQRKVLTSLAKYSYGDVSRVLNGTGGGELAGGMGADKYLLVARTLLRRRQRRNSLVIFDTHEGWMTTEEGELIQVDDKTDLKVQLVVQELMIVTNELMAGYARSKRVPFLFRNHLRMETYHDRAEYLKNIKNLIDKKKFKELRQTYFVRDRQPRAFYSPKNLGHAGLELAEYCHFTSPIRRYVDLINARQITAHLERRRLPYDQRALMEISSHINSWVDGSAVVRRRAESIYGQFELARLAVDESGWGEFSNKDFASIVSFYFWEGKQPSDEFKREIVKRAEVGALRWKVLARLLVLPEERRAGWEFMIEAMLAYLYMYPDDNTHVLNYLVRKDGKGVVEEYVYQEKKKYWNEYSAVVKLKLKNKRFFSEPVCAANERLAKQLAAHSVLRQLCGVASVDFERYMPANYQLDATLAPEFNRALEVSFESILVDVGGELGIECDFISQKVSFDGGVIKRRVVLTTEVNGNVYWSNWSMARDRKTAGNLAAQNLLYLLVSMGIIDTELLPESERDHLKSV